MDQKNHKPYYYFLTVVIAIVCILHSIPINSSFALDGANCPSGMIHYWKLDENGPPYEDFYEGNDALCTNCPTPVPGMVAGGQQFNGSNQVNVEDDGTFDWGPSDSFSIELWMKTDPGSNCSGNQVIAGRDDTSPTNLLHWWVGCVEGGYAAFVLLDTNGNAGVIVGTESVTDGSWHHIVAMREAGLNTNRLFVDGNETYQNKTYANGFDSTGAALNIGWLNLEGGYHFVGVLDELALYNKALSQEEILTHYNNRSAIGYCEQVAPMIVSTPGTAGVVGKLYTEDVNAIGNPMVGYSLEVSPSGMTINENTGVIEWTPLGKGVYPVTVRAGNGIGTPATQSFSVQVVECPSGMIHYWKLDENGPPYEDLYGGNDALCTNCPTPVTGIVAGGQQFSISTQVNAADDNTFDWDVSDSFSIEFWMKTDPGSNCSGNQVMVGRDDDPTGLHWWAGCIEGGQAAFILLDKTGDMGVIVGTTDLTDGIWHHVVAVRDWSMSETRVYVDGVEEAFQAKSYGSGFDSTGAALNIGWLNLGGGYHFVGVLDELALYNKALSQEEILTHYNNRSVPICGCDPGDEDTDGDGIPDDMDGCPNDATKATPGICGCSIPDIDSDGDGTPDCNDGCPGDPNKIDPGVCGCGLVDTDTDGDGMMDCRDNCPKVYNPDQKDSNSNGIGDACENSASKTICSILGDDRILFILDQDIFMFRGIKGETVTVLLEADPKEAGSRKKASLSLLAMIPRVFFLKSDHSELPNAITTKLPATGIYLIIVAEQPNIFRGKSYRGKYCLTLKAKPETNQTLTPFQWVER